MLVGNKCDLHDARVVSTEEGIGFAKTQNLLFIETSALDSTNVQQCFTQLITEIVHQISKPRLTQETINIELKSANQLGVSISGSKGEEAKDGSCC
jgi:GTPase SAR1 family protein